MSAVQTRQQTGTRRRTHRSARITLREPQSLLGKTVYIWGFKLFLPIAAQIPISQIICQDKDDVRFLLSESNSRSSDAQRGCCNYLLFHVCMILLSFHDDVAKLIILFDNSTPSTNKYLLKTHV
jgi:hypothetical protein